MSTLSSVITIEDLPWVIQEKIRRFKATLTDLKKMDLEGMSEMEYLLVDNQHSTYTSTLQRSIEWDIYSVDLLEPFFQNMQSRFGFTVDEGLACRREVIQEGSDTDWFFTEVQNRIQEKMGPADMQGHQNVFYAIYEWRDVTFAPQKGLWGWIDRYLDDSMASTMERMGYNLRERGFELWEFGEASKKALKKLTRELRESAGRCEGSYLEIVERLLTKYKVHNPTARRLLIQYLQVEVEVE